VHKGRRYLRRSDVRLGLRPLLAQALLPVLRNPRALPALTAATLAAAPLQQVSYQLHRAHCAVFWQRAILIATSDSFHIDAATIHTPTSPGAQSEPTFSAVILGATLDTRTRCCPPHSTERSDKS